MVHSEMRNQIEEREEEDPHDVDEVPVEAHHLDRPVILRSEIAAPRTPDDVQQEANADDHVQRVKASEAPIEQHEQLDFRRELRILVPGEVASGEKALVPVRVVLVALDAEEDAAKDESGDE